MLAFSYTTAEYGQLLRAEAPPSLPSRSSSRSEARAKNATTAKVQLRDDFLCHVWLSYSPLASATAEATEAEEGQPGLGLKERVGSSEAEKAGKKEAEWEAESCVAPRFCYCSIPLTQGQPCKANILKGRPSRQG